MHPPRRVRPRTRRTLTLPAARSGRGSGPPGRRSACHRADTGRVAGSRRGSRPRRWSSRQPAAESKMVLAVRVPRWAQAARRCRRTLAIDRGVARMPSRIMTQGWSASEKIGQSVILRRPLGFGGRVERANDSPALRADDHHSRGLEPRESDHPPVGAPRGHEEPDSRALGGWPFQRFAMQHAPAAGPGPERSPPTRGRHPFLGGFVRTRCCYRRGSTQGPRADRRTPPARPIPPTRAGLPRACRKSAAPAVRFQPSRSVRPRRARPGWSGDGMLRASWTKANHLPSGDQASGAARSGSPIVIASRSVQVAKCIRSSPTAKSLTPRSTQYRPCNEGWTPMRRVRLRRRAVETDAADRTVLRRGGFGPTIGDPTADQARRIADDRLRTLSASALRDHSCASS